MNRRTFLSSLGLIAASPIAAKIGVTLNQPSEPASSPVKPRADIRTFAEAYLRRAHADGSAFPGDIMIRYTVDLGGGRHLVQYRLASKGKDTSHGAKCSCELTYFDGMTIP